MALKNCVSVLYLGELIALRVLYFNMSVYQWRNVQVRMLWFIKLILTVLLTGLVRKGRNTVTFVKIFTTVAEYWGFKAGLRRRYPNQRDKSVVASFNSINNAATLSYS